MNPSTQFWLSPGQHRKRVLALFATILFVAIIVFLLAITWWQPWQAARARGHASAERLARMESVLARKVPVRAALKVAETRALVQPLVLSENDRATAQANLMQRFSAQVAEVGQNGTRCQVDSQGPPPIALSDPMRLAISAHLRCGNSEWLSLAESLEKTQPVLAIESVMLVSPTDNPLGARAPGRGVLDIELVYSAVIADVPQAGAAQ